MSLAELCNCEVVIADKETTVTGAAKLMRQYHVGDIVVVDSQVDGNVPIGLITDRDIVIQVLAPGLTADSISVLDVMTRNLETISEEADLWEALDKMRTVGVRRMPVVDRAGRLTGILTLDDALELIGEALADLVKLIQKEMDYERQRH